MPFASSNSYWGCAAESTYGVAASISTFTPVDSPKVTPDLKWLDDSDFRGSPVMHYDQVPGVFRATFDAKTYTYTDVYPNLLRASLGSTDTVASVGPSLWTHTIGLNNSPNTGSQSPSYTIINDSVNATYQILASRMDSLNVSFAADAAVENTFTFAGNVASVASASVSFTESTQHLVPAWACAASIGGVSSAVVESFEIDIKRNTQPIWTLGQQGPYNNFQGPIDVQGKISIVLESGSTLYANSLVRDQQQLLINLVDPVTNYSILYQMSAVQFEMPVVDQSKQWISLNANFVACANLTDTVTIGYSPIKCVVTNGVSTAY